MKGPTSQWDENVLCGYRNITGPTSEGEPTIHPEFLNFVKAMYEMGIVPNYTTNGLSIANDDEYSKILLQYTEKYCGGVAISANTWNPNINESWQVALQRLACHDININVHYIMIFRTNNVLIPWCEIAWFNSM